MKRGDAGDEEGGAEIFERDDGDDRADDDEDRREAREELAEPGGEHPRVPRSDEDDAPFREFARLEGEAGARDLEPAGGAVDRVPEDRGVDREEPEQEQGDERGRPAAEPGGLGEGVDGQEGDCAHRDDGGEHVEARPRENDGFKGHSTGRFDA